MTKEQCSLQPNYYGSSCDFQDLQSAVQQLTTKSDAQFEELKNEKWFHRIFNMVICPRKNNIRMAEQITSLAQAQGILIEILVRLADQDANIAGMVMQSQSDIRALAQNSAYLQERLYLLEDKSYGIKENENLKDLNSQQRNILSGCLNEASKLYVMPSNEQRLYANELLNYLNADAQVANLEDALDDLEDNAKRKILSCVITYMYLYDHTAESMEQDEQEDFIDLFDLGRKTIKSLKQQTVDTYRLRGVDGCIDRYITAPIEITEETPFEVELPEPKAAEGASEAQTEENGEEAIDTNAPREKLVLSGSIQNDGETIYKDKDIHFSSAIMNCKGTVRFINCTIHYNEDESRIYLNSGTALEVASSTVICHGNCKSGDYFIRTVEDRVGNAVKSRTAGSCTVKNSDFVACVGFLKGSYESFLFDKNKVIGSCSDFLYLSIENKARISGSRFFLPDKPTFEAKDENNRPGDAFIHCRGKKVLFMHLQAFYCVHPDAQQPPAWIIDMHTGSATSNIAKLAAASYRTAYSEFGNALNIIYANSNGEKEAFDVVSKELSDSADIFKKMGKELQIVIPRKGAYERFSLSEDIVRYMVLSLVRPGKKMTFDSFLQVLYDHYGIVIGAAQYAQLKENVEPGMGGYFDENQIQFQMFLKNCGLLRDLSDATSIVENPYAEVKFE